MQVSVQTTATRLDDPTVGSREIVVIRNAEGEVRIGPPSVTWATGWPYSDADNPLVLPTNKDGLWAVAESAPLTIEVLSI